MLKESVIALTGNDQFEGYSIDLIHEISKMLDFNYTIELIPDNRYDKQTGAWDRIVSELLQHRADIAIGDFTITSEREEVVDFSTPFMNTGISILYTKPMKQPPHLFAFMDPFSMSVWICIAFAYLGVSVLLYILGRFTPSYLSQPQGKDDNQFSLMNCMFLPRYSARLRALCLFVCLLACCEHCNNIKDISEPKGQDISELITKAYLLKEFISIH